MRAAVAVVLVAVAARSAVAGDRAFERALAAVGAREGDLAARVAAVEALEAATDLRDRERARAALVAALDDEAPDLRAAVAGALARGFRRDGSVVPPLRARLAREPDEVVAAAIVLALGATADPDGGAAALEPLLSTPAPRLRAAAATALGDLGGSRARALLLAALCAPGDDPDWAVRGAVLLALARCGTPADAGTVLVAYREGGGAHRWFARAALAAAVAALDPDPVPILDRLCADDDPRVSSAAAVAFVRAGRPDEVVRRLGDARPGVRAAAAAAVADAGVTSAVARVRTLATADPDRGVRWTAALALSRLDDPASDALLVAGVAADDPQVWVAALAECRRKTGLAIGRDADAWAKALARRREGSAR